jgi:hypothetical protein
MMKKCKSERKGLSKLRRRSKKIKAVYEMS